MTDCETEISYGLHRRCCLLDDMQRTVFAALVAALAIGFTAQSSNTVAAPLHYIENIDGELPFFSDSSVTLPLDFGVNTVTGQVVAGGLEPDFDSFAFLVPSGAQLVSLQVALADVAGDLIHTDWRLEAGSATSFAGSFLGVLLSDSPGTDTFANVPLAPNVYSVTHTSNLVVDPSATAAYTFTFVLVPEPSASHLLLGAISALRNGRPKQASRRRLSAIGSGA